MGYEITFVPTEKDMEQYKPSISAFYTMKPSDIEAKVEEYETMALEQNLVITSYCMKTDKDIKTLERIKNLDLYLRLYYGSLQLHEHALIYKRWMEDKDHEVYYCGWEYAHDDCESKNSLIIRFVESLIQYADIIPTADWYDERDKFDDKYSAVKELLDEFDSEARTIICKQIIEELKQKGAEKKYEEDDAYITEHADVVSFRDVETETRDD